MTASLLRAVGCVALASAASATPATYSPTHARNWTVTYASTYKLVTVTATNTAQFILFQQGTTPPTTASLGPGWSGASFIRIPVSRIATLSSTEIQLAELLGVRQNIVAVLGISYISSPCINAGYANGTVMDVTGSDGYSADPALLASSGAQVVFCDAFTCPGTPQDVLFPDAAESSLLGAADAIGFMSLFFNAEDTASAVFGTVASRFACTENMITKAVAAGGPSAPVPRVLFAYNYGGADGWYPGACPNYYCEAIVAAGGMMVVPAGPPDGAYGATSDAHMTALASTADIWIYASDNWASEMLPALTDASSPVGAVLRASPAVASGRVWDVLRRGINSWFEDRLANPDAFVQDVAGIVRPNAAALADAFFITGPGAVTAHHNLVWLRNVFNESAAVSGTTAACPDASAPAALLSDSCPTFGGAAGGSAAAATVNVVAGAAAGGTIGGIALVAGVAMIVVALEKRRTASAAAAAAKAATMAEAAPAGAAESA